MRKLYVTEVTVSQLKKQWGFAPIYPSPAVLFIRCNKAKEINWDKAPVYTGKELLGRKNVIYL